MSLSEPYHDACRRLHHDLAEHATLAFEQGASIRAHPPEPYPDDRSPWRLELEVEHASPADAVMFSMRMQAKVDLFRARWIAASLGRHAATDVHAADVQHDGLSPRRVHLLLFDSDAGYLQALHRRLSKFRRD